MAGCKLSLITYWATKVPGTGLGTGHPYVNSIEINHCSHDAYILLEEKMHNENMNITFSMLGGDKN